MSHECLHLLFQIYSTGIAKPANSNAEVDADYPVSDDSYDYDDEANGDRSAEKPATTNSIESNNVLAPPFFNTTEYTVDVKVGAIVKMECKPQNMGPSNLILWYNGSTLLFQVQSRMTNDQRVSLDNQTTLTIDGVHAADQGDYRCVVLPTHVEQRVRLNVQTRPVVHIYGKDGRDISEQSVTLHQGEPFEMECRGTGRPAPEIKWSTEGQRVRNGTGLLVIGAILVIEKAGHGDVRKYQCLADNGVSVGHAGVSISVRCKCSAMRAAVRAVPWRRQLFENVFWNILDKFHHNLSILVHKDVILGGNSPAEPHSDAIFTRFSDRHREPTIMPMSIIFI